MHRTIPVANPLRRLFTAVTVRSFLEGLGWPDREVIRYLAELLVDFTHIDNLHKIRNAEGRPVNEVVEMLAELTRLRNRTLQRIWGTLLS